MTTKRVSKLRLNRIDHISALYSREGWHPHVLLVNQVNPDEKQSVANLIRRALLSAQKNRKIRLSEVRVAPSRLTKKIKALSPKCDIVITLSSLPEVVTQSISPTPVLDLSWIRKTRRTELFVATPDAGGLSANSAGKFTWSEGNADNKPEWESIEQAKQSLRDVFRDSPHGNPFAGRVSEGDGESGWSTEYCEAKSGHEIPCALVHTNEDGEVDCVSDISMTFEILDEAFSKYFDDDDNDDGGDDDDDGGDDDDDGGDDDGGDDDGGTNTGQNTGYVGSEPEVDGSDTLYTLRELMTHYQFDQEWKAIKEGRPEATDLKEEYFSWLRSLGGTVENDKLEDDETGYGYMYALYKSTQGKGVAQSPYWQYLFKKGAPVDPPERQAMTTRLFYLAGVISPQLHLCRLAFKYATR